MSVLASAKVDAAPGFDVGAAWDDVVGFVRTALAAEAWTWYHAHSEDTLFTVHKWVFTYTVKVKDLYEVMVMLFGEDATSVLTSSSLQ